MKIFSSHGPGEYDGPIMICAKSTDSVQSPQGTILVVDDDQALRQLVGMVLKGSGYNVLLASSGSEAIATLAEHVGEVTVAVLDWTMPTMSGAEVCRKMRSIDSALPVLVVSGVEDCGELDRPNVNGFLAKPFGAKELIDKVALVRADHARHKK